MENSNVVELIDVKKEYVNAMILKGITLSIKKGEFVAITGHSGSGKSTLLHILGCLDYPTNGQYILNDVDVTSFDQDELASIRNQMIGFIFQDYSRAILPNLSVKDNLKIPLMYGDGLFDGWKECIKDNLSAVGILDKIDAYPPKLSGGEKQRVAIARALINNPKVILADEPTGSLDSGSSREVMQIIKRLNEEGNTIIFVTHERGLAAYASRQIIMKDGFVEKMT